MATSKSTKKVVKKSPVKGKVGTKTATTKTAGKAGPARKAPVRKAGKPGAPRPGTFNFEAPADFKPHFLEVAVRTEKDGLLGSAIKAIRYVGRYDVNAEDKKKFDIGAYDVPTLVGIQSRLSAKTFKTNGQKIMPSSIKDRNVVTKVKREDGTTRDKYTYGSGYRLPANTTFYILLRIGASKVKGNILTVGLKHIEQIARIEKNGVKKQVRKLLDKKDPAYRMIAGAKRFLPAAFKEVLLPPKRTRGANKKAADDSEE